MTSFLFAPENPSRMAAMRIGLGVVLLFDAAMHWPYVVELYSRDGMPMPFSRGTFLEPHAFSAGVCVVLFSIMLFALAATIVGWQTRVSLVVAFVLTATLGMLDPPGTFKKYSVIALHLLLLLACSQCGARASVDARVNGERGRFVRLTPAWPRRLIQLLLSSVYLGAVVTKIRLPDFGSGDMLMFSLLDERWGGNRLGMWLATQPKLLMLASYGTVLLELAGALLLWISRTRLPMLVILMLFHSSIALSMHVGIFSPIMVVALLAFSEPGDVGRLWQFVTRQNRREWKQPRATALMESLPPNLSPGTTSRLRRRFLSLGVYLLVGAGVAGIGYAQQSSADYAGVFHGAEQDEWEYVSKTVADEFRSPRKVKTADYFHRIEIGSRLGFLQTFGEHKTFRRGTTVYIVARLTQNHPELNMEWILQSPDGLGSFSQTQTLYRGFAYTSRGFRMDAKKSKHPAGVYTIVVKANGEIVARRSFELVDE